MKCPECNNDVPNGSKFCNHCGHKFEQENTIKCPNPECGHYIPVDSKFCPDCGCKITNIIVESFNLPEWTYYYPYIFNGKFGYKDIRNKQVVIEAIYDFARKFEDGFALVVLDGYVGSIDPTGGFFSSNSFVINKPTDFESIHMFKEGLACAKQNEKWGFIDRRGHFVIEPYYKNADDFNEGLAVVKMENGGYGYIAKDGNIKIGGDYYLAFSFVGRYARISNGWEKGGQIIDKNGKTIFEHNANESVFPFKKNDGKVFFLTMEKRSYILDESKNIVMAYDEIKFINEDLIVVQNDGKLGVVNWRNEIVIPISYEDCRWNSFSNDTFVVKKNGKWGVIDAYRKIILPFEYDDCGGMVDDYNSLCKDGKWGIINKEGTLTAPFIYGTIYAYHSYFVATSKPQSGYSWVSEDDWTFITGNGERVIPAKCPNMLNKEYNDTIVNKGYFFDNNKIAPNVVYYDMFNHSLIR